MSTNHNKVMELLRSAALAVPLPIWSPSEEALVFAHLDECSRCVAFYDEMVDGAADDLMRPVLAEPLARAMESRSHELSMAAQPAAEPVSSGVLDMVMRQVWEVVQQYQSLGIPVGAFAASTTEEDFDRETKFTKQAHKLKYVPSEEHRAVHTPGAETWTFALSREGTRYLLVYLLSARLVEHSVASMRFEVLREEGDRDVHLDTLAPVPLGAGEARLVIDLTKYGLTIGAFRSLVLRGESVTLRFDRFGKVSD